LTGAGYDEIAGWYDEAVRSGPLSPFHEWLIPIVLDLAGEVKGQKVCDLACGQGIVSRRLAEKGAEVVGVDVSAGMLDLARSYERDEPRGVTYIHEDAHTLDAVANRTFDGVVCNMALMDIPDLAAALRRCRASYVHEAGLCSPWYTPSYRHPVPLDGSRRRARSLGWNLGTTSLKDSGAGATRRAFVGAWVLTIAP